MSSEEVYLLQSTDTNGSTGSESSSLRGSVRALSNRLISRLSSSDRNHALQTLGIGPAAHLIRDAVLGERSSDEWFDPYANPDQPFRNCLSLLCSRLVAYRWMNRLLRATAWILVLLSFIEPPSWCDRNADLKLVEATTIDDFGTCGIILTARGTAVDGMENVQFYPNSSSMWLNPTQARRVEAFCLGGIFCFMLLQFGKVGMDLRRFFYVRKVNTFRLILLVSLISGLCTKSTTYSPFFRLLLLGTYLKSFQKELDSFFRMVSRRSWLHLGVHTLEFDILTKL